MSVNPALKREAGESVSLRQAWGTRVLSPKVNKLILAVINQLSSLKRSGFLISVCLDPGSYCLHIAVTFKLYQHP